MAVIIEGNDIRGADVGIEVPSNADIKIIENKLRDVGKGISVYDPEVQKVLGIPAGAPKDQVEEVVKELEKNPNASPEEMTAVVTASRLGKWLGNADLILKVTTGLIAAVKAGGELLK